MMGNGAIIALAVLLIVFIWAACTVSGDESQREEDCPMDIHTATEQAYRNGYEAGKRDAETKWTPVTEQLPERGQEVICYCGGVLKPTVYTHYFWDKDYDNWVRVTHWMPIPNPPTK